ncbi:jg13774 [Pararge aegeria aegeria]|uniref:FXNA-like protease n=1 Tax=Pararge aegeria aegeria TaxID=348720 RepID=A0A8S4S5W8_9NEOP|nr:jg13774 [Pararge aegeria aegeria]
MKQKTEDDPSRRNIPSPFLVLLLGFFMLVAFVTTAIEDELPRPIKEQEIGINDSNTFSEESANKYLQIILGDHPRVFGLEYHYIKTRDLKELFDSIAQKSILPIHTDWQFVDGYFMFGSPSVYRNLSNVVAVLEGESGFYSNGTIGTSILVNCHHDSVPFAIGASDDGLFCAAMVETLEKLSRRTTKLKHNIIFLSNGAEEMGLQGSHGFLSHPWSKGAIAVVNLDAAGMNGRPNLFQVTDSRVLEAFRRTTSRPMAQSLGEFLFSNRIIPSDTDFRIWRDFGDIMGVDIAFVQWGHIYHTRNDRPELINDGVMQNAGNMLLPLVRDLADYEGLVNRVPRSTAVYFDYMGWFLITFTRSAALAVDIIVVLLGFTTVAYPIWLFGLTPLYWLPYVIASVTAAHLFDFWRSKKTDLDSSMRTIQAMAATRFILSVLLFVLCCFPIFFNVRYLIGTPLFLMSVGSIVSMSVVRYSKVNAWQHLLLEVIVHIPATLFTLSLGTRLLALMIPITGRSASDSPDVLVTIASVAVTVYVVFTVSGIELLFSRKWMWIVLSGISVVCIIIMFIPMNPYRDVNTTQRHTWFHSQVTTYDQNFTVLNSSSGVILAKTDANNIHDALKAIRNSDIYIRDDESHESDNPLNKLQIRETDLRILQEECQDYLYCNLPIFGPRSYTNSLFVSMGPPAHFDHSIQLLNRSCTADVCKLSFEIHGTAHNTITIWPRENITLIDWPFKNSIRSTFRMQGRPVYNIRQNTNTYSAVFPPYELTLDFRVPEMKQADIILDISLNAHKINHPEDFTDHYKQLLEVMPEYMNIATFLSFRSNYVF